MKTQLYSNGTVLIPDSLRKKYNLYGKQILILKEDFDGILIKKRLYGTEIEQVIMDIFEKK